MASDLTKRDWKIVNERSEVNCLPSASIIIIDMADKKVFCNSPWTNLHVYWDGTYGVCCSETGRSNDQYNLKTHDIKEWYDSSCMDQIRSAFLSDVPMPICSDCYRSEAIGHESRRIKENFKTLIFTEDNFDLSYKQSPWLDRFENRQPVDIPVDWHLDMGNECNLACKMCHAGASSRIAAIMKRHGKHHGVVKNSWADDARAWKNIRTALHTGKVRRIHVMGGEPTIIKAYIDLLDYQIQNKMFYISQSFVTNGTKLNTDLMDKLQLFDDVDIEISLETLDRSNDYIRQGSNINEILKTIEKVKSYGKFDLVLRTVPQLLSIDRYHKVIEYAWHNKLVIESIPLSMPEYYAIVVLPKDIRARISDNYHPIKDMLQQNNTIKQLHTGRNSGTLAQKLLREVDAMQYMLDLPEPDDVQELRDRFVESITFWDKEFGLNFADYYPDWSQMVIDWGYHV
jgi:MoaA/NifB/PqqE/SkfB family radical SAM enzyme